jgi:peptide deformylase
MKIAQMGQPVLREIAKPLTQKQIQSPEIKALISDMIETMEDAEGVGLAAPQVFQPLQLAIISLKTDSDRYDDVPDHPLTVFINPVIKILDSTPQGFWEGCLSVPGLRGYVERPKSIQVEYLNQKGKPEILMAEGFLATVIQHELDHLFGVLYVDKLKDSKMFAFQKEYDRYFYTDETQEID